MTRSLQARVRYALAALITRLPPPSSAVACKDLAGLVSMRMERRAGRALVLLGFLALAARVTGK
jgi:hypothetical protein